jgi:hypothetical protein
MKSLNKKGDDLERGERENGLFNSSYHKIPCGTNCPYLVVTDTLNCQKETLPTAGRSGSLTDARVG